MKKIIYITGNNDKFKNAKKYADRFGFDLIQKRMEIKEIQSNSIENVAKDKARQAFALLKQPLIVSDSGWSIPSLNGFPGPYMRHINEWFSAEDFLKLMEDKKNRTIVLKYITCAISSNGLKLFKREVKGRFVKQVRGNGLPSDRVIALNGNKHTIAELQNKGRESVDDTDLWEKVHQWSETI